MRVDECVVREATTWTDYVDPALSAVLPAGFPLYHAADSPYTELPTGDVGRADLSNITCSPLQIRDVLLPPYLVELCMDLLGIAVMDDGVPVGMIRSGNTAIVADIDVGPNGTIDVIIAPIKAPIVVDGRSVDTAMWAPYFALFEAACSA